MSKQEYIKDLDSRIKGMEEYLKLKTKERDWHGVADAAMDIRELEAEKLALNLELE